MNTRKRIISFDIFDTLLVRKLEKPIDIFYCVRAKLLQDKRFLLSGNTLDNFPYLRIESEKQAREDKIKIGLEGEILLDDIYKKFQEISGINDEIKYLFKKTEINLEKEFIFAPQKAKSLYSQLKDKGHKLICISDMYLPKDIILDLLKSQGYKFERDEVFISGELGESKFTGTLYSKVQEILKIDKDYWIHYGDNHHSDIHQAQQFGIKAIHTDWSAVANTPDYSNVNGNHEFNKGIVNFLSLKQAGDFLPINPYSRIGYQIFGPFFFGFLSWLMAKIQEEDFEKILFFARDAQLLQILYEKYFSSLKEVDNEYIYLSRASIQNLSFTDWKLYRLWHIFSGKSKKYKVREVLEKLNLYPEQYLMDVYRVGFQGLDELVKSEDDKIKMHMLLKLLFTPIMESSSKLREKFSSYFSSKIGRAKKISLIDIGWVGNMQSYFANTNINQWHDLDIHGYYLGLLDSSIENVSPYYKMNGWLSSIQTNLIQNDLTSGGIELLEFVLTADHGSTLGYDIDEKNNIYPILEQEDKEHSYREKAMLVREGILKFFSDYQFLLKAFPINAFTYTDTWVQPFLRLIRNPTLEEANLLGDLTHSDIAGDNADRIFLAKKLTKDDFKNNPNAYQEEFEKSFWKSAFLLRNKKR